MSIFFTLVFHWEEAHRVDEPHLFKTGELQDLAPVPDLLEVTSHSVQLFDESYP